MLFVFAASAGAFVALSIASFFFSRTARLVAAFWAELLAVVPAAVAFVAVLAMGSSWWVPALWVFNGVMAVLGAYFISQRIQHEAQHRAFVDKYLN